MIRVALHFRESELPSVQMSVHFGCFLPRLSADRLFKFHHHSRNVLEPNIAQQMRLLMCFPFFCIQILVLKMRAKDFRWFLVVEIVIFYFFFLIYVASQFYFLLKILGSDTSEGVHQQMDVHVNSWPVTAWWLMLKVLCMLQRLCCTNRFLLFCFVLIFNSILGCWSFLSVALLQFGVYLWLILAIKCFALTRGAWWIYEYFCMGTKGQFLSYFVRKSIWIWWWALLGSSTAGMWHIKITIRQHEYCLRLPKIKGHFAEGARNPASIWCDH